MNEDKFNTSLRGFLKKVGITSQREIEKAVRGDADLLEKAAQAGVEFVLVHDGLLITAAWDC